MMLLEPVVAITGGIAIAVLLAEMIQRGTRRASWHRAAWHASLLATAVVAVGEVTGATSFLCQQVRSEPAADEPIESTSNRPQPAPEPRTTPVRSPVLRALRTEPAPPTISVRTYPAPHINEPEPVRRSSASERLDDDPSSLAKVAVLAWISVSLLLLLHFLARHLRAAVSTRSQARRVPEVLETEVGDVARDLGLKRSIRVRALSPLGGPATSGIWRPTLWLPADFEHAFSPEERRAVLLHELAHIAGRDALWRSFADVLRALVWWHPLVWWLHRRARDAAESAADEASLLMPDGPDLLAGCLVRLGRRMTASPLVAIGSRVLGSGYRSALGRRVVRLLDLSPGAARSHRRRLSRVLTGASLILMCLVLITAGVTRNGLIEEPTMTNWRSTWRQSLAGWLVAVATAPTMAAQDVAEQAAPETSTRRETMQEGVDAESLRKLGHVDGEQLEALRRLGYVDGEQLESLRRLGYVGGEQPGALRRLGYVDGEQLEALRRLGYMGTGSTKAQEITRKPPAPPQESREKMLELLSELQEATLHEANEASARSYFFSEFALEPGLTLDVQDLVEVVGSADALQVLLEKNVDARGEGKMLLHAGWIVLGGPEPFQRGVAAFLEDLRTFLQNPPQHELDRDDPASRVTLIDIRDLLPPGEKGETLAEMVRLHLKSQATGANIDVQPTAGRLLIVAPAEQIARAIDLVAALRVYLQEQARRDEEQAFFKKQEASSDHQDALIAALERRVAEQGAMGAAVASQWILLDLQFVRPVGVGIVTHPDREKDSKPTLVEQTFSLLEGGELEELRQSTGGDRRYEVRRVVAAVSLDQKCEVNYLSEVPYISKFELDRRGETLIANPVIETVQDGLILSITPRSVEAGLVELEISLNVQKLVELREQKLELVEDAAPVTVQIPRLADRQVESTRMIATGLRIDIPHIKGSQRPSPSYVLLRALPLEGDATLSIDVR